MTIQAKVRTTTLVKIGSTTRKINSDCERAAARVQTQASGYPANRQSKVAFTPTNQRVAQDVEIEAVAEERGILAEPKAARHLTVVLETGPDEYPNDAAPWGDVSIPAIESDARMSAD